MASEMEDLIERAIAAKLWFRERWVSGDFEYSPAELREHLRLHPHKNYSRWWNLFDPAGEAKHWQDSIDTAPQRMAEEVAQKKQFLSSLLTRISHGWQ